MLKSIPVVDHLCGSAIPRYRYFLSSIAPRLAAVDSLIPSNKQPSTTQKHAVHCPPTTAPHRLAVVRPMPLPPYARRLHHCGSHVRRPGDRRGRIRSSRRHGTERGGIQDRVREQAVPHAESHGGGAGRDQCGFGEHGQRRLEVSERSTCWCDVAAV